MEKYDAQRSASSHFSRVLTNSRVLLTCALQGVMRGVHPPPPRGVLPNILGGGVPHGSQNPDPISDQNV